MIEAERLRPFWLPHSLLLQVIEGIILGTVLGFYAHT